MTANPERSLLILEVLEGIATRMYERTKNPYWKNQMEWIKQQKQHEVEMALLRRVWA